MKNVCMKVMGLVAVGLGLLGMFLPCLPPRLSCVYHCYQLAYLVVQDIEEVKTV